MNFKILAREKTDFPFLRSKIAKDLQCFTQVCKIMGHLCGFITESIKRWRNCSILVEIHLLLAITIKQAEIRE